MATNRWIGVIGFADVPVMKKFFLIRWQVLGNFSRLYCRLDDGVMYNKLLNIQLSLRLAGCPNITVILTKADVEPPYRIDEVKQQITTHLLN